MRSLFHLEQEIGEDVSKHFDQHLYDNNFIQFGCQALCRDNTAFVVTIHLCACPRRDGN